MSTIIDSLVVELGLDPSKFDQGQQKALASLHKFADRADQSSQALNDRAGKRVSLFFQALQNPIRAVNDHLTSLITTSARAGDAVGGMTAAASSGMFGLAGAALLALGAFKGLRAVMQDIKQSVDWAQGIGFAQQWYGVPKRLSSSLATAAYEQTAAPQAQTVSWLTGLAANLGAFQSGQQPLSPALMDAFTRLGINPNEPLTQIVNQLPEALTHYKQMFGAAPATNLGRELGMSPALTGFFEAGPAAYQTAMKRAGLDVVTPREAKNLSAVAKAERDVAADSEKLTRVLGTKLAPAFVFLLKILDDVIQFLTFGNPRLQKRLKFGQERIQHDLHQEERSASSPSLPAVPEPAPQSFAPATPKEKLELLAIAQRESGMRNVYTAKHATDPTHYTASGYPQITKPTWQDVAPRVGIDTNRYPEAIDAPMSYQFRVALWLLRHRGLRPWSGPGGSIPAGMTPDQLIGLRSTQPALPSVVSHVRAIQTAHASTSNVTNKNLHYNPGPVTVNIQGQMDKSGIAQAVGRTIRETQQAHGFNAGFE